jgi:hypothetical protein
MTPSDRAAGPPAKDKDPAATTESLPVISTDDSSDDWLLTDGDVELGLIVEQMSPDEARKLTDRIRAQLNDIWDLIVEAYARRAWLSLDYLDWDCYCHHEFGSNRLRIPREERGAIVLSLRSAGLSYRAIGSATGLSKDTVQRAMSKSTVSNETPAHDSGKYRFITGLDGKKRRPKHRPRTRDERRLDALEKINRRTIRAYVAVIAWNDKYGNTADSHELGLIEFSRDLVTQMVKILDEMSTPTLLDDEDVA